jgi:hypothetical protein
MARNDGNQDQGGEALAAEDQVHDQAKVFSRDDIRNAILDLGSKGESEVIHVFGVDVEIRTPSLEDLLQYRDAEKDDTIMARAIANNCYVPGTEERVFEDADLPSIMKLKFTKDMRRLNKAVTDVLGGDEVIAKAVEDDTKSN